MARKPKIDPEQVDDLSGGEEAIPFEEALLRLEEIVKQMEKGELTLDVSLAQFAKGVALSKICLHKLDDAEKQIDKILHEQKGIIVEKPLNLQEDNSC